MLDDAKFSTRSPAQDAERARTVSEFTGTFLGRGFLDLDLDDMAKLIGRPIEHVEMVGSTAELVRFEVVRGFFREGARRVSSTMAASREPRHRVVTYLESVSRALAPASEAFLTDVAECRATRDIYRCHTMRAVMTVKRLTAEGQVGSPPEGAATYRFIGALAGQLMEAIQSGELEAETSLSDAAAYLELAHVVSSSLGVPDPRFVQKTETKEQTCQVW